MWSTQVFTKSQYSSVSSLYLSSFDSPTPAKIGDLITQDVKNSSGVVIGQVRGYVVSFDIISTDVSDKIAVLKYYQDRSLYFYDTTGDQTDAVGINSMLEQTAKEMTNEDYRNVVNADSSMVTAPAMSNTVASGLGMSGGNAPGLDISNLDFVKKAKSVLDLANQKSANKLS